MTKEQELYFGRAENEITEHVIYHRLALREKKPENRALLEKLSAQEKSHYDFWMTFLPGVVVKPRQAGILATSVMRTLFGVTFTTKLLENHEKDSIAAYEAMLPALPAEKQAGLRAIIEDERAHERALIGELKERRVAYIGFVALGLADAIVEITGVHAGFLGVTGSTLLAGVSGIIVGFAAAISMGSAAYLQAKQDTEKSAIASAFITGITYLFAVILLALPYFLIRTMATAFTASTLVGIGLLSIFTLYGAVVFERKFFREFFESVALMLGTAVATYFVGEVVGRVFHLNAASY